MHIAKLFCRICKQQKKTNILKSKTLFTFCLIILFSNSYASNLLDALLKVNKQWHAQSDVDKNALQEEQINSAVNLEQLISKHLKLVESTLRNRNVNHLNSNQKKNRLARLDELQQYWKTALYPKNKDFAFSIPYFIDAENTACAVGHLVIESGNQEIAEEIAAQQNNAFVFDIKNKDLVVWADEHGFTLEELAWIQPMYPNPDPCSTPPLSIVPTGNTCGNDDGKIAIDIYNQNVLSEIYWKDLGYFIPLRENLASGKYELYVKYELAFLVCEKDILLEIQSDYQDQYYITSECNGNNDEEINVAPLYNIDTSSLSFKWFDGSTNNSITNLMPNYFDQYSLYFSYVDGLLVPNSPIEKYYVVVSDSNSCTSVISFPIRNPTNYPATTIHTGCNLNNGSIDLLGSSTVPSSNILWSTGETTEVISNLNAGEYCVTIENLNTNCIAEGCYTVMEDCQEYTFANDDFYEIYENENLNLWNKHDANNTIVENDTYLDFIGLIDYQEADYTQIIVELPSNGIINHHYPNSYWNQEAWASYTPNQNFVGLDSLKYVSVHYENSNLSIFDTATVYINVLPNNLQQAVSVSAQDDTISVDGNETVVIDVLCNDFETTNAVLSEDLIIGKWKLQYLSGGFAGLPPFPATSYSYAELLFKSDSLLGSGYSAQYDYDGSYTISPTINSFTTIFLDTTSNVPGDQIAIYELTDSVLTCSSAFVADGFFLHFMPIEDLNVVILQNGNFGTGSVNADNQIIYPSTNGEADTLIYIACNNQGLCDTAIVFINGGQIVGNTAPIANNDYFETMGYPTFTFDALQNDSDAENNIATVTILNNGDCSNVSYDSTYNQFSVTFTDATFCTFDYVICDTENLCDTATVELQYYCYPWDYPVEFVYDTVNLDNTSSLNLANFCFEDSITYALNENPSNIQINFDAENEEIQFLNLFSGTDTLSYTSDYINNLDCITCGTLIFHVITFDFTNTIGDSNLEPIRIYPNPASEVIFVENEGRNISEFVINDFNGKTVKTGKFEGQLDIKDLSKGVYFIQFDGAARLSKFVKK